MYLVSSDLNFENSFKTQRLLEAYDTLKVSKNQFSEKHDGPIMLLFSCSYTQEKKQKTKKK